MLFLKQDTQDPLVGAIKLSHATATLKQQSVKQRGTPAHRRFRRHSMSLENLAYLSLAMVKASN
jgi:hypothetical protein